MNYQNQRSCQENTARTSCGCGNNSWRTPRSADCGCTKSSWRTPRFADCGCTKSSWRTPRSADCGCTNNSWRTPRSTDCGCTKNSWRAVRNTDCGCAETVSTPCNNVSGFAVQRNAGTVWKNRSGCCGIATPYADSRNSDCNCQKEAVARVSPCNDTPCAVGASEECALSGKSLAMVYSPHQEFQSLYDPREGLCRGTVFCELDKPFYGSGRGC